MTVLLVAGSRRMPREVVWRELDALVAMTWVEPALVIHGGCRGADESAGEWARARGAEVEVHRADWSKGRIAGPQRNVRMAERIFELAESGRHVQAMVVRYADSRGSADMLRRLRLVGVPTVDVVVPVAAPDLRQSRDSVASPRADESPRKRRQTHD